MVKSLLINCSAVIRSKATSRDKLSFFSILNKLLIREKFGQKKRNDVTHRIYDYVVHGSSYLNLTYLFKEVFIGNEYSFVSLNKAPVIIDCGANIGMSVLYFKKLYPAAHITAFEANPAVYKILAKNVQENNLTNVEVHNVALYDKETEISFFADEDAGSLVGSIYEKRGGSKSNEIKVRTRKLSDYLQDIDHIDLIKMDVEGAETAIIEDLLTSGFITKAREYIIEYHHNFQGQPSQLSSFLQIFESNGFNYNIQTRYDKLNSFQDILLHFYKA